MIKDPQAIEAMLLRNAAIALAYHNGASAKALARKWNLTDARIYQIAGKRVKA